MVTLRDCSEKSEATNRHININIIGHSKQAIEKSNEHPEWLLDDWNMDFRTKKSGENMGHGYKVLDKASLSGASCSSPILQAFPILKKSYGDSMHKVLHVGPDSCFVLSSLLEEEDTEVWGIQPYELDDVGAKCKSLVCKGIVHVADLKFSLPHCAKSFSLDILSDALDYLSPRYLNKTLPKLVKVSADGVVIFAGTFPCEASVLLVYAFAHLNLI
ncbi:hypothetical protein JHK87_001001 [Glycine soja]|nr:hypothetical protein JHK87_001001 [Glycine soja]